MDDNIGGRPPYFNSVEELEERVDAYFEWIKGEFDWQCKTVEGQEIDFKKYSRDAEFPTITGLCLYLGFESRQSFHDYGKREGFSYAIKKARLRIEHEYEKALNWSKVPTAQIFALKNLGWADKQEIDSRVSVSNLRIKDLVQFDDDEECGS